MCNSGEKVNFPAGDEKDWANRARVALKSGLKALTVVASHSACGNETITHFIVMFYLVCLLVVVGRVSKKNKNVVVRRM